MRTQPWIPSLGPATSRVERACLFVVGLTGGYFLPKIVFLVLMRFSGSAGSVLFSVLISYLVYVPVVWVFRRRRYLAAGILVSALVNILIYGTAVGLWWIVKSGSA
jgi:hypothetical protein